MIAAPDQGGDIVLGLSDIGKRYGESMVLHDIHLDIPRGQRHALIGPNGAGKSTLFDIASGRTAPSTGRVILNGEDITGLPPQRRARRGLARSFQITSLFPQMSVFENLRCAVLAATTERFSLWRRVERMRAVRERAETVLESIGLAGERERLATELSYAEQRALELGVTIAGGAQLILLDEPTAGMSSSETQSAIALIRRVTEGRTLLIIEHDMNVVFDLADRISVLARGELIASDVPAAIRADLGVREAYLGSIATPIH